MPFVESRTRVRYKETDQMGIAHHSNYIVWFEIGRTDLCRATGFTYREIEDRGRSNHATPNFHHPDLTTTISRSPTAWFCRAYIASAITGGS